MTLQVSQLTASGRGAVAVLKVCGGTPSAVTEALARHFTAVNGASLVDAPEHRVLYGTWDSDGTQEDVVLVRNGPAEWEICCHGGLAAVDRIRTCLSDVDSGGDEPAADWANELLLRCPTLRTAEYVLAHRDGLLADIAELIGQISPEERESQLRSILSFREFAVHLVEPWTVAIAGCPNAGKSSLLNVLIGYDRSIVFAQPGTTRDRIEAATVIDGWPYMLLDTAGVRDAATDQIEQVGVSIAESTFTQTDVGLLVVDSTVGLQPVDHELISSNPETRPLAILWNKTDLAESKPPPEVNIPVVQISATQKSGVSDLLAWLVDSTVGQPPKLTQPLPIGEHIAKTIELYLDGQIELGQLKAALLT